MLRQTMIGLAVVTLVGAAFAEDALARGGYRGGGGRHVGAVGARGAHISHPIAGRGVAYRGGVYRGARWGAVGAAAAGAAAVGAAGYYGGYYGGSNTCYRDSYGRLLCPNQDQY
jgi:hypothetical protein